MHSKYLASVLVIACLCLASSLATVEARECTGDVVIKESADVAKWSDCKRITGSLRFYSTSDLQSAEGFRALEYIGRDLYIWSNLVLNSLNGFSQLREVGGNFDIRSNPQLRSLEGFSELTTIGGSLSITENHHLGSVAGFSKLQKVKGGVSISFNVALPSLQGLLPATFETLDKQLLIRGNSLLKTLEGLESIRTITGSVEIRQNALLRSVKGLDNLRNIVGGQLIIEDNYFLKDLVPLMKLQDVQPKDSSTPSVLLQPLVESRCLPSFILTHVDTKKWGVNPKGIYRPCEELVKRIEENGLDFELVDTLAKLGLEKYEPYFERFHFHVEDFLDFFHDPNYPHHEHTTVNDHVWHFLIHDEKDRAVFQSWVHDTNQILTRKYGGQIEHDPSIGHERTAASGVDELHVNVGVDSVYYLQQQREENERRRREKAAGPRVVHHHLGESYPDHDEL